MISPSTVVQAAGKTLKAFSDYSQAKSNIKQLQADADQVVSFGKLEASRIRRDGQRVISDSVADLANSNLDISGSNSQAILDTAKFNIEDTAFGQIFKSNNEAEALRQQARQARQAQRAGLVGSVMDIGATVLKGAGM